MVRTTAFIDIQPFLAPGSRSLLACARLDGYYPLATTIHSVADLSWGLLHLSHCRYRNINRLSITYAFRPRLRPD